MEQLATLNKTTYIYFFLFFHPFFQFIFHGSLDFDLLTIDICFHIEAKYVSNLFLKKFGG